MVQYGAIMNAQFLLILKKDVNDVIYYFLILGYIEKGYPLEITYMLALLCLLLDGVY